MNFLYIAKGSSGEVRSMLNLALEFKYITKDQFQENYNLYDKQNNILNNNNNNLILLNYLNKYQIENLTADYISNNFDAVSYLSNLNSK
jgi:hypothetical protein